MGLWPLTRSFVLWRISATALLQLLLWEGRAAASFHSLRIFYTLIYESHQELPQYLALGYVNDQLFARFDAHMRKVVPQVSWIQKVEKEDPHFWEWSSQRVITQRRGFHTWQRMIGCELSKDGHKGGYYQYGYDGQDFISLDKETLTWTAPDVRAQVTKRRWEAEPLIAQSRNHFLEEECIELLQKFAEYGKESLLRKEPPVVKVSRQVGYDGLETLICSAYGFYPKEIDATWRRDREVWEEYTFRGSVAPNSDGTYHTWLSVQVHPKDRNRYRCLVEHAGLLGPLDLAWEESDSVSNVGLVVGVILAVVAATAAALLTAGVIAYKKKRWRDAYEAASRGNEGSGSLSSA